MLSKIQVRPGEHVAFMGMTGSGKTVLARHLLDSLKRVIVIDPKSEWFGKGWKRKMSLPSFDKEFRLVWAPKRSQDDKLAELLHRAWKKKHLTIYVDELQSLTDFFPHATDALTDIIRTGRSREVAVWISTQRPAWVPRWFLSESRHKFAFTLLDKADRQRAGDVIGDRAKDKVPIHNFLYHGVGMEEAEHLTLDLKRGKIIQIEPANSDKEGGE